ncbi:MAG TPA: sialidase family protein [Solirubrobacteraceae bacterium]|nr:sialidase family protein [Solirubrobacteraceae bacterium]
MRHIPYVLALGATLALSIAAPAAAADYTLDQTTASPPSTLTECPFGASDAFASAYDNAEVEPQVAVNPNDAGEVFGVWQQDRWPDGGARGLTASRSLDGGDSWTKTVDAPWAACQGGPARYLRVTDPWVSYDGAGNVYFIGQPIDSADLGLSAITATTWNRATNAWRTPKVLIEDSGTTGAFNDKVSITGDLTRPGYAYATWLRGAHPGEGHEAPPAGGSAVAFRGQGMVSRTTDGGQTWSTPRTIQDSSTYYQGNQIVVLPDGTLLDVAANLYTGFVQGGPVTYMVVNRSKDAGRTWSRPTRIAPLVFRVPTVNPDDGSPLRVGDYLPDIAVDWTTGDVYVVWSDALGSGFNRVLMSKSTDGGRNWTAPQPIGGDPTVQSFNHAVTVTDDGRVAVLYYDLRENTPDPGLPTEVWLTHSDDGGGTWSEQKVAHIADFMIAPESAGRGPFVGDYMGLEPLDGNDLVGLYGVPPGENDSDIVAVRAIAAP